MNLSYDTKLLANNGRVIVIGSRGEVTINPRELMARRASIRAFTLWAITPAEEADIHTGLFAGLRSANPGNKQLLAPSLRLQPIETQSASMPLPPADASIPPSPADSRALLKMLDVKPQQAPLISATTDADVEPGRQEGSRASSIPQALVSQEATSQADGLNPASMSATPDTTMEADVEGSGREGSSPASSNPQALALRIAAPQADGANPLPLIATPEVAKPAEEIGALISFGHRWNIGGTPALMPTEEMIAVFVFGMAVAGILFGILWAIIRARGQGIIDHLESSFIDDPEQLEGREPDLEAALRANLMALAQPLESKRFMKAFLP